MAARPISKEDIREKLKFAQKWITTTTTDIFSSNVPEDTMRYIIKLIITGDQVTTRVVEIKKKKEDGTYVTIIPNITVAATETEEIPKFHDLESPIITLEGGTNLAGVVSGNSVSVTVIYWDSP